MLVKNNIAMRIAGKVSRYIDASMNRATPSVVELQYIVFIAGITQTNYSVSYIVKNPTHKSESSYGHLR